MKEQPDFTKKNTQQGDTTSDRMHADNARERAKKRGISHSGGQASYETSNKKTGGDRGNRK